MASTDRISLLDSARTITDRFGNTVVIGSGIDARTVEFGDQVANLVAAGAATASANMDADSTSTVEFQNASIGIIGGDFDMDGVALWQAAGTELRAVTFDMDSAGTLSAYGAAIFSSDFLASSVASLSMGTASIAASRAKFIPQGGIILASAATASSAMFGVNNPYNLASGSPDRLGVKTITDVSNPKGVQFKTDGTKMFVIDGDDVHEYALSSPWDVTSATYTASFAFGFTFPEDIVFKSDGTQAIVVGRSSAVIYTFSLGTAWDVTTMSQDGLFGLGSIPTTFYGLGVKPDGTEVYVSLQDDIYHYTLSTPWDVTTATYDGSPITLPGAASVVSAQTIVFNASGTKFWIADSGTDEVKQFSVSTAWDVSTATYDSLLVDLRDYNSIGELTGVTFSASGHRMYMSDQQGSDFIHEFKTGGDTAVASLIVVGSDGSPTADSAFNMDSVGLWVGSGASTSTAVFDMDSTASLTMYPVAIFSSVFDMDAAATLDFGATGTAIFSGDFDMDAAASLITVGVAINNSVFDMDAAGSLTVTAVEFHSADFDIDALAALVAVGEAIAVSNFDMDAAASLTTEGTDGNQTDTAQFDMTAAASLTVEGAATTTSDFSMAAVASLTTEGTSTASSDFTMTALATFTTVGEATTTSDFTMTAAASLTTIGEATTESDFTMTAAASLTTIGESDVDSAGVFWIPDTAYNINSALADGVSVNLSAQLAVLNQVRFKPDGTLMYAAYAAGSEINEYALSPAWDITSASFNDVKTFTERVESFAFNNDGTRLITGDNGVLRQYDLSPAWDVSSAVFDDSNDQSSVLGEIDSIEFSSDGLTLFLYDGSSTADVFQFTLSSAFDITTAVYDNVSLSTDNPASFGLSIIMNATGTEMFLIDQVSRKFDLSVAWDLSTAVDSGITFTSSASSHAVFNPDGSKLYIGIGTTLHQYSSDRYIPNANFSGVATDATPAAAFNMAATAALTGSAEIVNTFDMDATASLTMAGASTTASVFDMDAVAALTVVGESTTASVFDMDAVASLTVIGETTTAATFDMDAVASLTVVGISTFSSDFDMDAVASLTTVGTSIFSSVFDMDATASLTVEGTEIVAPTEADFNMNAAASFTATGEATAAVPFDMDAIAAFTSDGESTAAVPFDMDATASITTVGTDGGTTFTEAAFSMLSMSNNYGLLGAAYTGNSFDVGTQNTTPQGLAFNSDGTKMFTIDSSTSDTVYEYSLSVGFDLSSTVAYSGNSFSVGTQETAPTELEFNSDGTKMFVIGTANDTMYEYSLSVGFDLSSTVSYSGNSFSVNSQDGTPQGFAFNSAGTKFFVAGAATKTVYEYTVSTGFDLSSTVAYSGNSFAIGAESSTPQDIEFNNDGTRMFIIDETAIHEYSLSTAYDLSSTVAYTGTSFTLSSQDSSSRGFRFNDDGSKLFMVGATNDTVYEYTSVSKANVATLTGDSVSVFANRYLTSSVSGGATNPNNANGAPDGTTTTDGNANNSWTHRWSFGNAPTALYGSPQPFTMRWRKGSNSGNPDVTAINIYVNGSLRQNIVGSTISVTQTSLTDVTREYTGTAITSGDTVDIEIVVSAAGGSPSTRNSVELDSVTWAPYLGS